MLCKIVCMVLYYLFNKWSCIEYLAKSIIVIKKHSCIINNEINLDY